MSSLLIYKYYPQVSSILHPKLKYWSLSNPVNRYSLIVHPSLMSFFREWLFSYNLIIQLDATVPPQLDPS